MGALQIVFADNPQPAWKASDKPKIKKSLQSQDNSSKVKRKVGSRMKPSPKQLRARKKFAAAARKRSREARAAKRKKKNPYQLIAYKKGVKGSAKRSGSYASKREIKNLSKALKRKSLLKGGRHNYAIRKARAKIRKVVKAAPRARKRAAKFAAASKKAGYTIKKIYISPKSLLASAKTARRKKRVKGKRKTTSRKGSQVAKRRKKRKSVARKSKSRRKSRRSARRAKRGRVIMLKRKGQKITIKRNPNLKAMVEQYSGFQIEELGSLLVGGAIYGTVDGLAAKYAPGIYAYAARIPVVGTTVVPAAIGMALNYAGKRFGVKPLSMLGEGIVGAAVVAMGIQASQYLPGVSAPVSGMGNVDFTPGRGVLMGGYPRDGADFGNVDFTPGPGVLMGAQPQLGMEAQLGGYARDGADFGLIPEGLGLVPEGLGGLA